MHKETLCVHGGRRGDQDGAVITPIQPATVFAYLDSEAQCYPRYFNTPNQVAVAAKLAAMEGAQAGVIFSSGMAAVSTTMLTLLDPGDHAVLLDGLYGGTHTLVTDELDRLGIRYSFAAGAVTDFASAITGDTKVIYVESPTNPLLSVVDIEAIAAVAKDHEVTTVIDNTFASPIHQNPIALGMDVVIHSGTKYLGGHSDLCCGAVLTSAELAERIRAKALNYGGSLNALSCHLLERSLKTLSVRMERQTENAGRIANFLEGQPAVRRVYYPGLASHPGHGIADRQMSGFAAMLAFELTDEIETEVFLRGLHIIAAALSLGGVESTICEPATTSHRKMAAADRERYGIVPGLLRFSVGIENGDELIADLEQALSAALSQPAGAAVTQK